MGRAYKAGVMDLTFSASGIATLPHRWVMIGRGIVLGIESQA
jgi:hypothetical protein